MVTIAATMDGGSERSVEWASGVFGQVTDALVAATLNPLNASFNEAYTWLLDRLGQKEKEVEEKNKEIARLKELLAQNTPSSALTWTTEQIETFKRAERITGVPIAENQRTEAVYEVAHRLLDKLYVRDPLTELDSYHIFNERLKRIIENRKAGDPPCTVVMCDLNSFSLLNAMLTHATTDQVLKAVASYVKRAVKGRVHNTENLTICRRSGDELYLILPGKSEKQAKELMHEINQGLCNSTFEIAGNREGPKKVQDISLSYGCYTLGDIPEDTVGKVEEYATRRMQSFKNRLKEGDSKTYYVHAQRTMFRGGQNKKMLQEIKEHGAPIPSQPSFDGSLYRDMFHPSAEESPPLIPEYVSKYGMAPDEFRFFSKAMSRTVPVQSPVSPGAARSIP